MHLEILIEDQSGKIALDSIIPKLLAEEPGDHTYRLIAYKGVGRLPKNLRGKTDPRRRILLDRLPKLLQGYGKSLRHIDAAVVVVVDRGTWELLADAIHNGGAKALKKAGWPEPGIAKCRWAQAIAPHMDVNNNLSPSFRALRRGVHTLVSGSG